MPSNLVNPTVISSNVLHGHVGFIGKHWFWNSATDEIAFHSSYVNLKYTVIERISSWFSKYPYSNFGKEIRLCVQCDEICKYLFLTNKHIWVEIEKKNPNKRREYLEHRSRAIDVRWSRNFVRNWNIYGHFMQGCSEDYHWWSLWGRTGRNCPKFDIYEPSWCLKVWRGLVAPSTNCLLPSPVAVPLRLQENKTGAFFFHMIKIVG